MLSGLCKESGLLPAAGRLGLARVAELVLAVFGATLLECPDCPLVHDMFLSSHGFPDREMHPNTSHSYLIISYKLTACQV